MSNDAPTQRSIGRLLRPLVLVMVLGAILWGAHTLPAVQGWIALARTGALPWPWLLFGGGLYCALGLPRQALGLACGLALGWFWGFAVATLATVLGSALAYGAIAAGMAAPRSIGRFAALRAKLMSRPFRSVLALRLMPFGSALLVNLAAGAFRIGILPFLGATLIGSAPQNLVFVLLGSGARIGHSVQIALAGVLACASIALGIVLLKSSDSGTAGLSQETGGPRKS